MNLDAEDLYVIHGIMDLVVNKDRRSLDAVLHNFRLWDDNAENKVRSMRMQRLDMEVFMGWIENELRRSKKKRILN